MHRLSLAVLLVGCGTAPSPPVNEQAPAQKVAVPAPAVPAPAAADKADLIRVSTPRPGEVVQSPLRIAGEARGKWYFEATFPVTLLDAAGRTLVQSYAQAQGEWMTEAFVPFGAELRFEAGATTEGTLVLERSNPSGLPEHADALRIPVRFAAPPPR